MRMTVTILLLGSLALVGACSKNAAPPPAEGSDLAETPRPARTLALPDAGAGDATAAGPVVWDVPEGWVEVPPSSSMRKAQYKVPGSAGDGECIVYYFGRGQGGDAVTVTSVHWKGTGYHFGNLPFSSHLAQKLCYGVYSHKYGLNSRSHGHGHGLGCKKCGGGHFGHGCRGGQCGHCGTGNCR